MRSLALALFPLLLLAACKSDLVCPGGETDCGGRCVSLQLDAGHCGACGNACGSGISCSGGVCATCAVTCKSARGCAAELCQPDLYTACGATSQLFPLASDLSATGPGRSVSTGILALAASSDVLYAAAGFPAATVDLLPADPAQPTTHVSLAGGDLEGIAVHGGAVFVSNADTGSLVVLSVAGALLDELPLPNQQAGPNPHGIAFVGASAYLALAGRGPGSGQAIAVIDLAGLAACTSEAAPPACGTGDACAPGRQCRAGLCRLPCAEVKGSPLDLTAIAGAADDPGLPFPGAVLAAGGKVYVTLGNLKLATAGGYTGYFEPAGSGRLAVVDPAAGDAVSIVDLGAGCGNPSGLALQGTTLWVTCGSFSFPGAWPGGILPLDLSQTPPAVGTVIATGGVVPRGLTVCGGKGYLGDMASGIVLPFDPAARSLGTPVEVCPLNAPAGPPSFGFAYVSDVACAP